MVKEIRIDLLEEHSRQMQGKEQFDGLVELARTIEGDSRIEEFKADITRAHNVSEHLLRVLVDEHRMEPINVKVMGLVIYNVVYGALASAPGVVELHRWVMSLEQIQRLLPQLIIRKFLGR